MWWCNGSRENVVQVTQQKSNLTGRVRRTPRRAEAAEIAFKEATGKHKQAAANTEKEIAALKAQVHVYDPLEPQNRCKYSHFVTREIVARVLD